MRRYLLAGLVVSHLASGADLKARLDELIASAPALRGASVGFEIRSLPEGRVLYEHHADRRLVPASNMKLFTTALALEKLGPACRFQTTIGSDRAIDTKGRLAGDLVLVGGGDPSLSGRAYPYRYSAESPDPSDYSLRPIEELADQLVARGLKRVDGRVVGDDRRYVWEPYPADWAVDDAVWDYGAPVSALIVDDNSFVLTLRPAPRAGDLATVWLSPSLEYFEMDDRVRSEAGAERKVDVERSAAGHALRIRGRLPLDDPGFSVGLAVDDPARYAAVALRDALQRRGVSITGNAVARHRRSPGPSGDVTVPFVFARRESPPLAELLEAMDKVSQNLHAEVMLRESGLKVQHEGSREAGLAAMDEFLSGIGIAKESYSFRDGSGLARRDTVSPAAILQLLVYMDQSANHEVWRKVLPIGGVDGTLAKRFADHPEAKAIHAKTGALFEVRATSGYADSPTRGRLAFSLLVNHYNATAAEINREIDQMLLALLQ